jgi:hypothetical protein
MLRLSSQGQRLLAIVRPGGIGKIAIVDRLVGIYALVNLPPRPKVFGLGSPDPGSKASSILNSIRRGAW